MIFPYSAAPLLPHEGVYSGIEQDGSRLGGLGIRGRSEPTPPPLSQQPSFFPPESFEAGSRNAT